MIGVIGEKNYSDERHGYICFLGDGVIQVEVNALDDRFFFNSQRISGLNTVSPRGLEYLKQEWGRLA